MARANELRDTTVPTLKFAELPYAVDFMGAGLFWSIVSEGVTPGRIVGLMVQRGVRAGTGKGRIRICPPLTITKEDLLKGVEI